jgi:hypothetical protein
MKFVNIFVFCLSIIAVGVGACKKKKQVANRVSSLTVGSYNYYCQATSMTPTALVSLNYAKLKVSINGTSGSFKVSTIFANSTYPSGTATSANSTPFTSANHKIVGNCVSVEVPGNDGFTVDILLHEGYANKCAPGVNACNMYARSASYSAGTVSDCSGSVIISPPSSVVTCM